MTQRMKKMSNPKDNSQFNSLPLNEKQKVASSNEVSPENTFRKMSMAARKASAKYKLQTIKLDKK